MYLNSKAFVGLNISKWAVFVWSVELRDISTKDSMFRCPHTSKCFTLNSINAQSHTLPKAYSRTSFSQDLNSLVVDRCPHTHELWAVKSVRHYLIDWQRAWNYHFLNTLFVKLEQIWSLLTWVTLMLCQSIIINCNLRLQTKERLCCNSFAFNWRVACFPFTHSVSVMMRQR